MALDPDESYDAWVNGGMIVYHETGGSEEGLSLFNEWSAMGPKYPGLAKIEYKWKSFGAYTGTPLTIGTLKWMLKERGLNWRELLAEAEPGFEALDPAAEVMVPSAPAGEVIEVQPQSTDATGDRPSTEDDSHHLLRQHSLTGSYEKLKQSDSELIPALGQVAMQGQYTIFSAAPNVGKTLIVLWLLWREIAMGRLDPKKVFYINADDNHHGMLQKLELTEEMGIEMLVPGYCGFTTQKLPSILWELSVSGEAKGAIVILDTLKKFSNPIDKGKMAAFNNFVRPFCTKGGTVIALNHVNKKRDDNGKAIYSGTSDVIDDADAALTLDEIGLEEHTSSRLIGFERMKGRGGVVQRAAFRYSIADGLSYKELLASVEEVDPDTLEEVRQAEQVTAQEPIIEGIKACIRAGTTLKMSLIRSVANQLGASQRKVKQVLEDHTGTDPMRHHWTFTKGVRGALNYSLL